MRKLSNDQARRYALGAQGLIEGRATGRIDVRHFRKVVDQIGLIQLDSVNVFSRAHYMPFFSRIGPYDLKALDDWLWSSGELFEYWGHEASLIPSEHHRLFRWRMDQAFKWKRLQDLEMEQPEFVDSVYRQVAERGPLRTRDLEAPGDRDATQMWGWSNGKVALEALFLRGRVSAADRTNFVRMYDLPERVIPEEHLEAPAPGHDAALGELLLLAASAMGVATADDLADYYRIRMPAARPVLRRLVAAGDLVEVEVEGWGKPGYLRPDAALPRWARGTCLLSPFDNLIWYRPRVERIWGFHYRIEIYVPEAKRVHGYYVLPFLLDGDLVARVDLKTDRRRNVLQVKGSFAEPGVDKRKVGPALREELDLVADWQGLEDVVVDRNGDLHDFL
ncbi:MAG TPA: crosslink repair DNA glycosylase YcaQ family protein [Acidimicrobiia bacterium]|nr:crosslink repair DNA glycosylase YcaQ family protein [Acidimicrobiia bacterium]